MSKIDKVIHQPVRLRIMASLTALEPGEELNFTTLRDLLEVTDGNLGAHIQKLEEAGYIKVKKAFVMRKPCTFVTMTPKGQVAFEEHVQALEKIIHGKAKRKKP